MPTYTLRFHDDRLGVGKKVEFDAQDASAALAIAKNEAPGRVAELWQEEEKLCTIRRSKAEGGDIWMVA